MATAVIVESHDNIGSSQQPSTQAQAQAQPTSSDMDPNNPLDTPLRESAAAQAGNSSSSSSAPSGASGGDANGASTTTTTSAAAAAASTSHSKTSKSRNAKPSSLKADGNPLTVARRKRIQGGAPLLVNFDERVVVHTVPYWDPCGATFYDNDDADGPRGPNCCSVL